MLSSRSRHVLVNPGGIWYITLNIGALGVLYSTHLHFNLTTMSSPRIAIIIYSMYGHIAKCMLCSNIVQDDWYADLPFISGRVCQSRYRFERRQCDYLPVRSNTVISTSVTNNHYSESLRLSQKTSLLLCTLLRSPTIRSLLLIPSRNTTASSSESPHDMETCPPNSRYVISACYFWNRELKLQIQTFWDATGQLWATGALAGKYAGIFVSTAGLGGGQESTVIASLSTLAHHGIIFVPLGYSRAFPQLTNLDEVHGGMISFSLGMNDFIYII